jgi:hypothetical protein
VLRGGPAREVSTHEPDGLGRIALGEEAVRIVAARHGDDNPRLLPLLMDLAVLCSSYGDFVGSNDAAKRAAALAARVLRAGSPVLAEARENARKTTKNLDAVLKHVRRAQGSRPAPLSRRRMQFAALELFERRGISSVHVDGQRVPAKISKHDNETASQTAIEQDEKMKAETARAVARLETPCAGCGASCAEGSPAFKRCAACQAVAYCTRECQKAHWKIAHKRDCATMAGAAGGDAANAPSA